MSLKEKVLKWLATAALFFTTAVAKAQPNDYTDDHPDAGSPWTGGIIILLIMVVCYIAVKIWQYCLNAQLYNEDGSK